MKRSEHWGKKKYFALYDFHSGNLSQNINDCIC